MSRAQQKRAIIVLAVLVAIAILGRHFLDRGDVLDAVSLGDGDASVLTLAETKLGRGSRTRILAAARRVLEGAPEPALEDAGEPGHRLVILSLSRGEATALVARGEGDSLQRALFQAAEALSQRASPTAIEAGRLKVDIALELGETQAFDANGQSKLGSGLDGVWLPKSDLILLPEEVLARGLLNSKGKLRSQRIAAYLAEGGHPPTRVDDEEGKPGSVYRRVTFDSMMEGDERFPLRLYRGNNRSPEVSPEALLQAAAGGGEYLLRHQQAGGDFDYSYDPKTNTVGDQYNLLRHAGTCYALAQLYRATGDDRYLVAARRGLEFLLERVAPPKPEHATANFEAIVSPGEEAKLGGAALAILAVVEYQVASGDAVFASRAERLARFLLHQQNDSGRFDSKYFYGEPDPEPFESIYYPGEAILALARLYRLDPREEWLTASRRGADWLIEVRDADKALAELPHDHWLLMGLDELDELTGEPRYGTHATRIAQAIVDSQRTSGEPLDWIGSFYDPPRSTPTATRAEGLVAMHRLARRSGQDAEPYLAALLRMAAFQRRCQLTPESVLYLPRPERAFGGFRRSLTRWEVRIDYVQHNVAALLGLRALLLEERSDP